MTDEELAAIKSRCFGFRAMYEEPFAYVYETTGLRQAVDDNEALVAEVERLRVVERSVQFANSPEAQAAIEREHERWMAEHAAMREIVQVVATVFANDRYEYCLYCGATNEAFHTPDCMTMKARALLARETPD